MVFNLISRLFKNHFAKQLPKTNEKKNSMLNIFQYLYDTKGKPIPFEYKLLYDIPLTKNDLIINCNLDLSWSNITYLPDNLTVNKNLYLINSKILSLPNNLIVKGDLDVRHTKIKQLPDNLTVNGNLKLGYTNITSLPDNLTVNGNLSLSHTKIKQLPDNLIVKRNLDVRHTEISYLPEDLCVGGNLYCWKSLLESEINSNKYLLSKYEKQIKYYIYWTYSYNIII